MSSKFYYTLWKPSRNPTEKDRPSAEVIPCLVHTLGVNYAICMARVLTVFDNRLIKIVSKSDRKKVRG
jgi:hypothetical protein